MVEEVTLGELLKLLIENRPLKLFLETVKEIQKANLEAYYLGKIRGVEVVRR
jgi:hypothetical protein